ncbi:hypothetical protein [Chelonobacter oris]|nr:hypothetical protein [Chelonobacter oris]
MSTPLVITVGGLTLAISIFGVLVILANWDVIKSDKKEKTTHITDK